LRAVGDEPQAPLIPILTCGEPTLEGLHKLYAGGHPALGLFSDEGGSFIGGHSMAEENRLRTVAGLSSLWDAAPIRARSSRRWREHLARTQAGAAFDGAARCSGSYVV
jgi:hypothetical protein